jgi:hypothetical protein
MTLTHDAPTTPSTIDPDELAQAFGQPSGRLGPLPPLGPGAGLEDVWAALRSAGEATGLGLLAASVVTGLKARLGEVAARLSCVEPVDVVLSGPWRPEGDPRWLRELLSHAGGRPREAGRAGALSLTLGPPGSGAQLAVDLRGPGPRLPEAAEVLAAALHPGRCADLVERHAARLA